MGLVAMLAKALARDEMRAAVAVALAVAVRREVADVTSATDADSKSMQPQPLG